MSNYLYKSSGFHCCPAPLGDKPLILSGELKRENWIEEKDRGGIQTHSSQTISNYSDCLWLVLKLAEKKSSEKI